jgi:hypothetical protein
MTKFLSVTAIALLIAAASADAASARHYRHGSSFHHGSIFGNSNAELRGNNGNSIRGSNSVGHIKGGNSGAGS